MSNDNPTGRSKPPSLPPLHNIPHGESRRVIDRRRPLPELDYTAIERRLLAHIQRRGEA